MRSIIACSLVLGLFAVTAQGQDIPRDLVTQRVTFGPIVSAEATSRCIEYADFDLDTDLDVIVVNQAGVNNEVYFNGGAGLLAPASSLTAGSIVSDAGDSRGFALGDIDNDGDIDVYVTNSSEQANFLYRNMTVEGGGPGGTSPGFFQAVVDVSTSHTFNSRHAQFADVDGDLDLDLFVVNWAARNNQLFINQGGDQAGTIGTFLEHTTGDAVNDGGNCHGLAFADVNGDTFVDLFVTRHDGFPTVTGEVNHLYLGDGTGDFTHSDVAPFNADIAQSLSARFGDIDGDGDADLFVANGMNQNNEIYVNQGGDQLGTLGTFVAMTTGDPVTDGGKSIGARLIDIDFDSDLDLLVSNRGDQPNKIYLNDGTGDFAVQSFGRVSTDANDSYDITAGDIDGDGVDADILVANRGDIFGAGEKNDLYRNWGRQWNDLEFSFDPSGGGDPPLLQGSGSWEAGPNVQLDILNAEPNRPALLFWNLFTAPCPCPLLGGTIVPAPDPNRLVVFGSTGGSGVINLPATLPPAVPELLDIFVQVWVNRTANPNDWEATNALRIVTPYNQ